MQPGPPVLNNRDSLRLTPYDFRPLYCTALTIDATRRGRDMSGSQMSRVLEGSLVTRFDRGRACFLPNSVGAPFQGPPAAAGRSAQTAAALAGRGGGAPAASGQPSGKRKSARTDLRGGWPETVRASLPHLPLHSSFPFLPPLAPSPSL